MATLEELQVTISRVLQDNVFTSDDTTALINQGIRFCASIILLPALETSGVVSTVVGASEVELPADWAFDRNLYQCNYEGGDSIKVLENLSRLFHYFPNYRAEQTGGYIECACLAGNNLVYYPIPTAITELTCHFYKTPEVLVDDGDNVLCLPVAFHEELLVNYTLWKCFSELEDGFEGAKTNTVYYRDLFNTAVSMLDSVLDHGQSRCRPTLDSGWV